jgi:hypothetical protein
MTASPTIRRAALRLEKLEDRQMPDAKVAALMAAPAVAQQHTLQAQPLQIIHNGPHQSAALAAAAVTASPHTSEASMPAPQAQSKVAYSNYAYYGWHYAYNAYIESPSWSSAKGAAYNAYYYGYYGWATGSRADYYYGYQNAWYAYTHAPTAAVARDAYTAYVDLYYAYLGY